MRRGVIGALALIGAVLAAGPAGAVVTVFGDSFAATCSHYARDGRRDPAALEVCSVALSEAPLSRHDLAATYVNRATMLMHAQQWTSAARDLDAAVNVDGSIGEARVNRGAVYVALGRPKDALAEIDAGLQLGSEEPEKAYYNRAIAHEMLEDVKAAYFDYLKAAELKPTWTAPQQELVRFKAAPAR